MPNDKKTCAKCKSHMVATCENFVEYKSRSGERRLRSVCRECDKIRRAASRERNRQSQRRHSRKWREKNKEKKAKYDKEWRKRNPNYTAASQRRRYHENPQFKLKSIVSRHLRRAIKGQSKLKRWEEYLGYTMHQLQTHIERQFSKGMTWDNYGSFWNIDHIVPVKAFNIKHPGDEEFKACWALSNLRPLHVKANRQKWFDRTHLV